MEKIILTNAYRGGLSLVHREEIFNCGRVTLMRKSGVYWFIPHKNGNLTSTFHAGRRN